MTDRLRILIVEDSEDDALLVMKEIDRGVYKPGFLRVEERAEMERALNEADWDIVLSDYSMPKFSIEGVIEVLQASGKDLPLIVVSGRVGEDVAVSLIKAGVNDYVMKDHLPRLNSIISRELKYAKERRRLEAAQEEVGRAHGELKQIFNAMIPLCVTGSDFKIVNVNDLFCSYFQMERDAVIGRSCYEVWKGGYCDGPDCAMNRILGGEKYYEYEILNKVLDGGDIISCLVNASPYYDKDGKIIGLVECFTDITERRRVEESFRESEARYRFIADQTRQLLYDYDIPTRQVKWFGAIEGMTGYSVTEFQSINIDRWAEMIHEDDREFVLEELARAAGSASKFKIDYRFKHRDGTWRNLHDEGLFFVDSGGQATRMMGSMWDVTEDLQSARQLRMVKHAIDRVGDMIAWIAADGSFLYVNSGMVEGLGYSEDKLRTMKSVDVSSFSEFKGWESFWSALGERGSLTLEGVFKRSNGVEYPVEASMSYLSFEGMDVCCTVARDVSDRKQEADTLKHAADELQKSFSALDERSRMMMSMLEDVESLRGDAESEREKLATAISAMTEAIVLLDRHGEVVLYNESCNELIGRKQSSDIAKKILQTEGWFPYEEIVATVLSCGQRYENDLVVSEEPLHVMKIVSVPIGGMEGALITLVDITRERELSRAKDELITTVSHELRTPLTMIKLFFSNAIAGVMGDYDERMGRGIDRANTSVSRLSTLIDGLLEYSRLERGVARLAPQDYSVHKLVEEIRNIYEPISSDKNRVFTIRVDVKNRSIKLDAQKIYQVLTNLLDNAIKFTDVGGSVELVVNDDDGHVRFAVIDDGIGIAPEFFKTIFERFRQVGRTYGPGIKGLGLGLSICREIVERHNGKIWVESEMDKGSRFIFVLPRSGPQDLLREDMSSDVSMGGSKRS
jgi:PAS domain S-box-containing protein